MPPATDAGLVFIGRIRTPWTSRMETPRQGRSDGPLCRIEVFEPWVAALDSLNQFERVEVLYWLHLSRRDLVMQSPASDGTSRGTFSLRSPARPNPIGTSIAKLVSIEGAIVSVRGLDAWTGRRCSTSSPIAHCSRRLHRPSLETFKWATHKSDWRRSGTGGWVLSAAPGFGGAEERNGVLDWLGSQP